MSDIPEKLRDLSRWLLATDTDIKMPDEMIDPEIAADYTEALEAYLAEKKLLVAENEQRRQQLGNLLAIIHRDGGHHTQAVGERQSVEDAHQKWGSLMAENGKLRAALSEIVEHCDNPGAWNEIVQERIIERCEETARDALAGSPPAEQEKPNE